LGTTIAVTIDSSSSEKCVLYKKLKPSQF